MPAVFVFPINPLSISWAAEYARLLKAARAYQAVQADFASAMMLGTLAPDLTTEDDLVETAQHYLSLYKDTAGTDKTLIELASAVVAGYGLTDELKASGGSRINFGLLLNAEDTSTAALDRVIAFDKTCQLARQGLGEPSLIADSPDASSTSVWLRAGPEDDPLGLALLPLAYDREQAARAAAGVLRAVYRKLWDSKQGDWVAEAQLLFCLPAPYSASAKGGDSTASDAFVDFVAPRVLRYENADGAQLTIGFSADGQQVGGWYITAQQPMVRFIGSRQEAGAEMSTYMLTIAGRKLLLTLQGVQAELAGTRMKQTDSYRAESGHGTDTYAYVPPVLAWLHSGLAQLVAETPKEKRTAVSRVLQQLADKLPYLRLGFYGPVKADDGAPRFLPATGDDAEKTYYGEPARIRALTSLRRLKREQFAGSLGKKVAATSMKQLARLATTAKPADAERLAEKLVNLDQQARHSEFVDLEQREADKLENEIWNMLPEPPALTVTGLDISSEQSAVCGLALTLWGPIGEEYGPIWRSPVLSPVDLSLIFREAEELNPPQFDGDTFQPVKAINAYVARSVPAVRDWMKNEEGSKLPFVLIGTALVDLERLKQPNIPTPLQLGAAMCDGRQVQLGACMADMRFPTNPEELLTAYGERPHIFMPTRIARQDLWSAFQNLALFDWDKSRRSLEMREEPGLNWASFDVVRQSKEFERSVEVARKKLAKKGVEAPPDFDLRIYHALLTEGLLPWYGGGARPAVVSGGRRAYAALGGTQGRAKRVGQTRTASGEWTPGRVVSPDAKQRAWATKPKVMYRDVFGFAASMLRQAGVYVRAGGRRFFVDQDKVSFEQSLKALSTEELLELQKDITYAYEHKNRLGQVPEQLENAYKREQGLLAEGEEAPDFFARDYLDQIAKLNPVRRARKARRARRSRRAERNPLTDGELKDAVAYAASKSKTREPGDLPRAFERLSRQSDPQSWELTPARVSNLFPRTYEGRDTWLPARRMQALTQEDMVSRVGPLSAEAKQEGRQRSVGLAVPFEDPAVLALTLAEAGLSLDEAIRVWQQQADSRRTVRTTKGMAQHALQPSSAICKLYRRRRLTAYTLPTAVVQAVGPNVLLLMSPTSVHQPRVMTYRQGAHIDCDMIGKSPEDMPEILGKSLQATLYWLAEKQQRLERMTVYVGRIGQPDLYVAYRPGQAITLAQISKNLQAAAKNEAGARLSVYSNIRAIGPGIKADEAHYYDAVRRQIGVDAAAEQQASASSAASQQAPFTLPEDDEPDLL